MEGVLGGLLFAAFLAQASCLQCYKCEFGAECTEITETCREGQTLCRAILMRWYLGNETYQQAVDRGCAWREGINGTTSYTSGNIRNVRSQYYCGKDLCNRASPPEDPKSTEPNGLQCQICHNALSSCNSSRNAVQNCTGQERQCLSVEYSTNYDRENISTILNGGCIYDPSCRGRQGYRTAHTTYMTECCNSSLCNNATSGLEHLNRTLNGVTCYSWEMNKDSEHLSQNRTTVQCTGEMSLCMAAVVRDARAVHIGVIKGCATPAWCQFPNIITLLPVYHNCCQGNLCNDQVVNKNTLVAAENAIATLAATVSTRATKMRTITISGSITVSGSLPFLTVLLLISTNWDMIIAMSF